MKRFLDSIRRFHESEEGAEGLEKLLIIAAIVLPLLGLLIFFRDWISDWIGQEASDVRNDAGSFQDQF